MTHPGSVSKPKVPKKPPQPTAWRMLITAGLIIVFLQVVLSSVPALHKIAGLGEIVAQYKGLANAAATVLIAAGLLALVFRRRRFRNRSIDKKPHPYVVVRHAVATELSIPTAQHELITVHIRRTIFPRLVPGTRVHFYRAPRKVRITIAAGRLVDDPGIFLAERLSPLLRCELKRHSWDPPRGLVVLVAGTPDPAENDAIPRASVDPRERAIQVLGSVVGKNLEAEITEQDAQGNATKLEIRHPTTLKLTPDNALMLQARVDQAMPSTGDRGWGLEILPQEDKIRLYQRAAMPTKVMHPIISDYASEFDPDIYGSDPRLLPCATAEGGLVCGWNISRKTDKPHALLVGPTGGGKTNAITTMVVGAARQGSMSGDIDIWGLDPKMIELMGLRNFPGVSQLAFKVEHMAQLIDAAYDEMMHRYEMIANYDIHPDELPALVLILDEYLILVSMLNFWWKTEKKGKGPCPQLNKIVQMLALSRSAALYILLGVQRPDASLFSEGARDNLRFRGSLGHLSPQGAGMMWNNQAVGVRPSNVRGRGVITSPDGLPLEAQYWFTPRIDPHPMYRDRLDPRERQVVEALTPQAYTPRTLTKDDLWLPPSAELPKMGSLETEMSDVQDVIAYKDLDEGDIIKLEDSTGAYSQAIVEDIEYDDDSGQVTLDIKWTGGSAEQIEVEGSEQVWYLGNALATTGS